MTQVLYQGTRKARVLHKCFHCYRKIGHGQRYGYQNNKYDGSVYTLRWHMDCEELANECRDLGDRYDMDEGFGPLRDEWCNSGEYHNMIAAWRGQYPHVICRMELTDQLMAKP